MSWRLPTSLTVSGVEYPIRSDFRDVLTILQACTDPELPDYAKQAVMVEILYKDWRSIPEKNLQEAADKAIEFIDAGNEPEDNGRPQPRLMDWEQDSNLIVPAINRVAGVGDIRALEYLHWWTFLGYYMEIGECLYANVLNIRSKKAKGKKLEKWEKDFYKENKAIIQLREPQSDELKEQLKREREELKRIFG